MATYPDEVVQQVSKAKRIVEATARATSTNSNRIAVSAAVFMAVWFGVPFSAPAVALLVFVAWGKK
jgi:hypothetical protein